MVGNFYCLIFFKVCLLFIFEKNRLFQKMHLVKSIEKFKLINCVHKFVSIAIYCAHAQPLTTRSPKK